MRHHRAGPRGEIDDALRRAATVLDGLRRAASVGVGSDAAGAAFDGNLVHECLNDRHGRVLVVDDDRPLRSATARILRTAGYVVDEAESAEAALDLVRTTEACFELVLSDHHMPGMSGIELANQLADEARPVPVLLLSGAPPHNASRIAGSLVRPVSGATLLAAVEQVLDATPADSEVEVIIIDDHQMFTDSLRRVLEEEPGVGVLGVATTAARGIERARRTRPRVALVDFHLPDGDGATVAAAIQAEHPGVVVVMLTAENSDTALLGAIDAGCAGFVTKDQAPSKLFAAIRSAAAGEVVIDPSLLARLVTPAARPPASRGRALSRARRGPPPVGR